MTLDYYMAYFAILFVATITPGPNMLLAVNHGVNHGLARTIYSGLGNLAGNLLMALVSVMGLGAVLAASGFIFNIIKWIGALYLIYVGVRLIFERVSLKAEPVQPLGMKSPKNRRRLFLDGFFIAVGNPKGILFFTALFPQFINVHHATLSAFMIVFITLGIVAFGCYMIYALFGVRLNGLFLLPAFRKGFNRISGAILIGTGLAVALSRR